MLTAKEKEYSTKIKNKNEFEKLASKEQSKMNTQYNIIKFHLAMNYITTEERSQGSPLLTEVIAYFRDSKKKRVKVSCLIV